MADQYQPIYVWSSELDIGVEPMNHDHQVIIDLMSELHRLTISKAEPDKIQAQTDTLAQFAREHFSREEEYLEEIKYPGLKQHKEIHRNLLQRFDTHAKEFASSGYDHESGFFRFLNVWLFSHIKGIDSHYGEHVKTKKPSAAS